MDHIKFLFFKTNYIKFYKNKFVFHQFFKKIKYNFFYFKTINNKFTNKNSNNINQYFNLYVINFFFLKFIKINKYKKVFFFIFKLLNFFFFNFIFIFPFLIMLLSFWSFFLKNNFYVLKQNLNNNDKLINSNFNKKIHFIFFLNWNLYSFIFLLIYIFILKIDFNNFWFNHLKINNFILILIFIYNFIYFFFFIILKNIKINSNNNLDYYFSIINIFILSILLYLSNNFYTLLFILELNSLIILYKFSVSKYFLKKNKNSKKNNQINFFIPKHFLNMLFFQYWINFFSSILLMFFIFNLIYIYGSSEWFFLNLINFNYNNKFIFLYLIFLLGFFLKLGITPFQLFKIEVYKGLPFLSLFFYTILYFLIFFTIFVFIFCYNITNVNKYVNSIIFFFIILGSLYLIILLFNVNFLKSFFAYSSILNINIFLILILSYF